MNQKFLLIAGPCSAESREQVLETAKGLAASGIGIFRAGVWKPRSKPGLFEGVGEEALKWLTEVKRQFHLPIATEVSSSEHVHMALAAEVDYLWIGARTTTNPFLVQEIADAIVLHPNKPKGILVKNPISPDVNLWVGAIERLQSCGAGEVMAVHRGFQTGQPTDYRNAPCWSISFALKKQLPAIRLLLDPSHLAGNRRLIPPLIEQGVALGYDGFMIESHIHPDQALSDADQQLTPDELHAILGAIQTRDSSASDLLLPLRQQIDEIDDGIFALINKRMEVSRKIGQVKKSESLLVFQEGRFAEIMNKRLKWAKENGLSAEMVETIMNAIHEESCKLQM